MFGNSEKNVTAFVTSLVIPSSAAVLSPNAHSRIASTVLIIAFQILLGNSFKKLTTPLNALFICSTRLLIMFLNPSQLSYRSLNAPANGFTRSSKSPCQLLLFTKLITLLNAFGIVSVKNVTIFSTTVPIAVLIASQTFTSAARASSFVAINPTIAATRTAIRVTTKIIGFAAMVTFINACTTCAAATAALNPCIAVITVFISVATLKTAKPAPIPANTLTIVSPLSAIQPSPSRSVGRIAATISLAFSTIFPKPVAIFSNAPLKLPSVKSVCSCPITSVIFSTAFVSGVLNFS